MDYISGEKFVGLSDYIYNKGRYYENYYKYPHTFNIKKINKSRHTPIIYTTLYLIKPLFDELRDCGRDVLLITHNGDLCVDEDLFLQKPDCIREWYAQNVDYVDDSLHPIPIGLENSRWFKKDKKILKLQEIVKTEKKIKNLVYLNLNLSVKHNANIRQPIYVMLRDRHYVTTEYGKNGIDFNNYLNNLYNHKFVISPEGNGIDTHRTWESMYINTIPIEKRNINNQFYTDLPICFVNEWEEITEEFLENEYVRISKTKWNLEKLDFNYWKNKILWTI